jgi:hypothetical protein
MANDPGGNRYTGIVRSDTGAPLEGVEVKIRYTNSSNQSILQTSKTGKDGIWSASIPNGVDLSTVTITYVKSGSTSITIKNPKVSDTFQFPPPTIDPFRGGSFSLQGAYDSGKYLVSSLSSYDQGLLDYNLAGALQFINNYKDTGKAAILIKASESQIGNYDREPSASNGTANSNFGSSLQQKKLSEYRASNLETYIKQYFKDSGQPTPNIQKSLAVNGPPPPSPFPARDTPEYQKVLEEYKQFQYVSVDALFTGPPCIDIPFTGSQAGNANFIKPVGATKITIDALLYPDRFGFSSTGPTGLRYTDTYYQNPNAIGSLASWGFIIFLRERLDPSGVPGARRYTLLTDGSTPNGDLRQSLIDDWFLQEDGTKTSRPGPVAYQIIQYNRNYSDRQRINLPSYRSEDYESHINFCFNSRITVEGTSNKVYGYEITRADLVYDLKGVADTNSFTIGFISGNISGGGTSLWKYRLCP